MAKYATLVRWESTPMVDPSRLMEDPPERKLKIDPITPYLPIAGSEAERRSTKGSAPFTTSEIRRGYRRIKG